MKKYSLLLAIANICRILLLFFCIAMVTLAMLPATRHSTELSPERKQKIIGYLNSVGSFGYGGQVILCKGDEVLLRHIYGYQDREKQIPTTDKTIFGIASSSKMFTAVAILKLESEGRLLVTDTLGMLLKNCPKDKASISIHQLLTHSSGIRGGDVVGDYEKISKPDLVALILKEALSSKPGARFVYSNAGFNLLAHIIELKSGMEYGAYLKAKIFKPLKMKQSFIWGEPELKKRLVSMGYNGTMNNGSPAQQFNPRTWGGGSVCSSAEDLLLFSRSLYRKEFLSAMARSKLFGRHIAINRDGYSYYGYGCMVYKNPADNVEVIDFNGATEIGFNCTVRMFPEADEIFISLSNSRHSGKSYNREFLDPHIKNLWREDKHFKLPPAVINIDQKELSAYAGVYQYGNSTLTVTVQGKNLVATAEGIEASAVVYAMTDSQVTAARRLSTAVSQFMESYQTGNSIGFKKTMSDGQLKGYEDERDALLKKYGAFKSYTIKGIYPDEAAGFLICPLIVEFEKGREEVFTLWNLTDPEKVQIDYSSPADETTVSKIFARGEDGFFSYNFFRDKIDCQLQFQLKDGKVTAVFNNANPAIVLTKK